MSRLDLAALVVILAAALGFVALGVPPESLAAIAVAAGGLFTVWRTAARNTRRPSEEDAKDTVPREMPLD
jgi:Flp pilus assembly protein TadB